MFSLAFVNQHVGVKHVPKHANVVAVRITAPASREKNSRCGGRETTQQTHKHHRSSLLFFFFLFFLPWLDACHVGRGCSVIPSCFQAQASVPPSGSLCRSLFGLSSQAMSLRDAAKQNPNYAGCAALLGQRRASRMFRTGAAGLLLTTEPDLSWKIRTGTFLFGCLKLFWFK